MGTSYNPPIVTDGLVCCLDAANVRSYPKTGTTWTDLVGGNNGTLTNGPTFSSDNGGSIVFDGSDDYVDLGAIPELSGVSNLSICCWCKLKTNTKDTRLITKWNIGAGGSNTDSFNLWYDIGGSNDGFAFAVQDGGTQLKTGENILSGSMNQWNYAVGVLDGSQVLVYVNGILKDSTSGATGINWNTNDGESPVRLAAVNTERAECDISMSKLYSRALTPDEIRQNYQATLGRFT